MPRNWVSEEILNWCSLVIYKLQWNHWLFSHPFGENGIIRSPYRHIQFLLLLYYLLPFIKHFFSGSQGQCFGIRDFTFDDYKDSVIFVEVISRLYWGPNANSSGVSSKWNLWWHLKCDLAVRWSWPWKWDLHFTDMLYKLDLCSGGEKKNKWNQLARFLARTLG